MNNKLLEFLRLFIVVFSIFVCFVLHILSFFLDYTSFGISASSSIFFWVFFC